MIDLTEIKLDVPTDTRVNPLDLPNEIFQILLNLVDVLYQRLSQDNFLSCPTLCGQNFHEIVLQDQHYSSPISTLW